MHKFSRRNRAHRNGMIGFSRGCTENLTGFRKPSGLRGWPASAWLFQVESGTLLLVIWGLRQTTWTRPRVKTAGGHYTQRAKIPFTIGHPQSQNRHSPRNCKWQNSKAGLLLATVACIRGDVMQRLNIPASLLPESAGALRWKLAFPGKLLESALSES